jgi:hypothetical protein
MCFPLLKVWIIVLTSIEELFCSPETVSSSRVHRIIVSTMQMEKGVERTRKIDDWG